MRNQLMTELAAELNNRGVELTEEVKGALFLVLAQYDVSKRCTDLATYEGDRNELMIKHFLMAKVVQGCTEKTVKYYQAEIVRFFETIPKAYDEITADDVRYYFALKMKSGWSTTTINNARRNISAFYHWLSLEEYISKNPMNKITPLREEKKKKEAFTDLEVEKLRDQMNDLRYRAILETLLSTGCRVSELVAMKKSELEGNKITVHGKGKKDRVVFLNAKAVFALEKYLNERNDDNPYIFPKASCRLDTPNPELRSAYRSKKKTWWTDARLVSETEPMDKSSVEEIIRSAGKKVGVKAHPHKFRRTCATNALRKGMPIEQVSRMLGHAQLSTTQIYLDLDDSELENIHKKIM